MSTAVGRTPAVLFYVERTSSDTWSAPTKITKRPDESDFWTVIQSQKSPSSNAAAAPYVHPLVRRSSTLMSNSRLQMCTESLGSETGSGDFSNDGRDWLNSYSEEEEVLEKHQQQRVGGEDDGNQLMSVNYHCSVSRRRTVSRSFPPLLPSISCRDGTCIQMKTHRYDGRLVVHAVPIASQNYLHACRHDGRLLLSYIDCTAVSKPNNEKTVEEQQFPKHEEQMEEQVSPLPSYKEIDQYQEQAEDEEDNHSDTPTSAYSNNHHYCPGGSCGGFVGKCLLRDGRTAVAFGGQQAALHVKAAEQRGDAAPHTAVQRAQPAALLLEARCIATSS